MRKISLIGLVIVVISVIISFTYAQNSNSISVRAGYITKANLYYEMSTFRWGGVIGYIVEGNLSSSPEPFMSIKIEEGKIEIINVFASNLKDGKHYFAALPYDTGITIDVSKIENITEADLEENGIFNAANFPVFHPNYDSKSDNPKNTFCCNKETILISGKPFTAFKITLKQNVPYYLLKYKLNDSLSLPLFVVNISDYSCYNSTTCQFEFMLPAGKTYQFYVLSKYPEYEIEVWIDGEKTTQFEHVALPYLVKVKVTELFSRQVAQVLVGIQEINGNNLFILPVGGNYISRAIAYTRTDNSGEAEFIIAPTNYPPNPSYKISVVVFINDENFEIAKELELYAKEEALPRIKKTINGNERDLKDTVNWLRPIANCAFKYLSTYGKTLYKAIDSSSSQETIEVVRGIPYTLVLKDPNAEYMILEERNSYIVMAPAHLNQHNHIHQGFKIKKDEEIVIIPTSEKDNIITLSIYNSNNEKLYDVKLKIGESTCSPEEQATYEPSHLSEYKDAINAVRPVLNVLYYAVN